MNHMKEVEKTQPIVELTIKQKILKDIGWVLSNGPVYNQTQAFEAMDRWAVEFGKFLRKVAWRDHEGKFKHQKTMFIKGDYQGLISEFNKSE
jgi:hypothetical protein